MQTPSVDQFVGQTLGNYRVERLLARGRLSAIYLAQSPLAQSSCALSLYIIPERFSSDARSRFLQRFRKEAAALTKLQHPRVLPVLDHGEQSGYPYLVTPYMMNGSLTDILKQEGRLTHEHVLEVLEQIVDGLEYAHSRGIVHGTLKPSNLLLNSDQSITVAGFGLMHILQVRGIEQNSQPYAHLLSIADTWLAAPEYVAPEIVQGKSIDTRSDIYALGIILFELLSGKLPFTGTNPLDVAKMHVEQTMPSLRALCPDLPIALVSVVNHALERDPAQRFQHASELVEAFAQVSRGVSGRSQQAGRSVKRAEAASNEKLQETPATGYAADGWQLMPPIVTGRMEVIKQPKPAPVRPSIPSPTLVPETMQENTFPVVSRAAMPSIHPEPVSPPAPVSPPVSPISQPISVPPPALAPTVNEKSANADKTYEWWTQPPLEQSQPQPQQAPLRLGSPEAAWTAEPAWNAEPVRARPTSTRRTRTSGNRSGGMSRRQVVALLAVGGVVAAGAAVGVNVALARKGMTNLVTQPPANNHPEPKQQQGNKGTQTNPENKGGTQTNPGNKGGTQANQPGHMGTVIGSTNLAVNSSMTFTNPADNKMSILIRLPNGNFVAYETACTHQGVTVNYDPGTQTITCPAHGAIFDPADNGAVLQDPATRPLPSVAVHVNTDGTVTTA